MSVGMLTEIFWVVTTGGWGGGTGVGLMGKCYLGSKHHVIEVNTVHPDGGSAGVARVAGVTTRHLAASVTLRWKTVRRR